MLELLAYLRANGFKTFIVSGGGIEFMRPWSESVYGVPPDQVVGSSIKTEFFIRDGVPVLLRLPQVNFVDDKAGKPVGINAHIGRRPIAAFGNSDGDLQMLEWIDARGIDAPLRDDHSRHGCRKGTCRRSRYRIRSPGRALDIAPINGRTVVDMKSDWKEIFPCIEAQDEDLGRIGRRRGAGKSDVHSSEACARRPLLHQSVGSIVAGRPHPPRRPMCRRSFRSWTMPTQISRRRPSVIRPLIIRPFRADRIARCLRWPLARPTTDCLSREGSGTEATRSLMLPGISTPSRSNIQPQISPAAPCSIRPAISSARGYPSLESGASGPSSPISTKATSASSPEFQGRLHETLRIPPSSPTKRERAAASGNAVPLWRPPC